LSLRQQFLSTRALVDELVPELKRRERYRTFYEGKNLRENLLA
jgi:hypothetical protein